MLRIRISFNADPDPDLAFFPNADPDPVPDPDPDPGFFDTLNRGKKFLKLYSKILLNFFNFFTFFTFNGIKHDVISTENAKMVRYPGFIDNF